MRAAERWALAFEVDGVVGEVGVRPGDPVGVGEWLASLDATPLDREVAEARARLQAAKVRRAAVGGTVWVDNGNPVGLQSDASEAEQLPTDVGAFDAGVAASAAMLRRAVVRRDASELRAPAAGRVGSVAMRPGVAIKAGQTVLVIENDERFEVVLRLPGPVPSHIRVGAAARAEWTLEDGRHRAGLRVLRMQATGRDVEVILAFAERLAVRPSAQIDVRFP